MTLYTIYARPRDYPGQFVVRRWSVTDGIVAPEREPHAVCGCLAEARESIPDQYVRIKRYMTDDPCIVEVWL